MAESQPYLSFLFFISLFWMWGQCALTLLHPLILACTLGLDDVLSVDIVLLYGLWLSHKGHPLRSYFCIAMGYCSVAWALLTLA